MRSIFWKIFIWFWIAITLMGAALTITTLSVEPEPFFPPRPRPFGARLGAHGYRAIEILEETGAQALAEYVSQLEETDQLRLFLFDQNGEEVFGRELDQRAQDAVTLIPASGGSPVVIPPFTVDRMQAAGGRSYVVVAQNLGRGPANPGRPGYLWASRRFLQYPIGPRVLAVLITAGLVCYWLARSFTKPIVKLRTAAQELAAGNLSARVSPAIGSGRNEIADLARDFDLMAERIQSLMNSERRLLRDISHELRSPLTRLNVALELARQNTGPGAEGALNRIEKEAALLNELIGQLLTLARLKSGSHELKQEAVDLVQLLNRVVSDADFEAGSLNRRVEVVGASWGEVPISVVGSAHLIRSAIENILRNAIRYTPEGTAVQVELRREPDGERANALISVRDQGSGVPENELEGIFSAFYRVAEGRDRKSGGTGLGLAITERAIKFHRGSVRASNDPHGGLRVEIRLPV